MTKTLSDANALRGTLEISDSADGGRCTPEATRRSAGARAGCIRMLRLRQVLEMTGLGKTTIYQLQKEGRFPKGVPMTSQSVRWVDEEVRTWVTQRIQARKPR